MFLSRVSQYKDGVQTLRLKCIRFFQEEKRRGKIIISLETEKASGAVLDASLFFEGYCQTKFTIHEVLSNRVYNVL